MFEHAECDKRMSSKSILNKVLCEVCNNRGYCSIRRSNSKLVSDRKFRCSKCLNELFRRFPEIHSKMWDITVKFCGANVLWIFAFVTCSITTFLMIMYNAEIGELKKFILPKEIRVETVIPHENRESVQERIQTLNGTAPAKGRTVRKSQWETKNAKAILSDTENKTPAHFYKSVLTNLKQEVYKTEQEVKMLQNQVSTLTFRREEVCSQRNLTSA